MAKTSLDHQVVCNDGGSRRTDALFSYKRKMIAIHERLDAWLKDYPPIHFKLTLIRSEELPRHTEPYTLVGFQNPSCCLPTFPFFSSAPTTLPFGISFPSLHQIRRLISPRRLLPSLPSASASQRLVVETISTHMQYRRLGYTDLFCRRRCEHVSQTHMRLAIRGLLVHKVEQVDRSVLVLVHQCPRVVHGSVLCQLIGIVCRGPALTV